MSRYIDEDALIADLDKGLWGKDYDKALAEAIIRDAPTIEIIRCRECKYWEDFECQCDWASTDHEGGASYSLDRDADDFCSYGSRSEKPNNSKERSSE